MSILEKITGKTAEPPSAEIGRKLAAARAALPLAEERHSDLSYKAAIGEAADAEAATALGELRAARDRVAALESAEGRAREIEAAKAAEARASIYKSQINAVREHFRRRDAAVVKLSEHLAAAIGEYEKAVAANEKAIAAVPGGIMPAGSICERGIFSQAVSYEMFRLSARLIGGDPVTGLSKKFPGAQSPTLTGAGEPEKIEPLSDKVKKASEHVLGKLTGAR